MLVLAPVSGSTTLRAGGLPDRLAGWDRIDSLTYPGPDFPALFGLTPESMAECGVQSIAAARYRRASEEISVTIFRTGNTSMGFALFSEMVRDSIFTGQMGYAVLSVDSSYLIDYGSIVAVLSGSAAPRPYQPPVDFRNALHDYLIAESDFAVMQVNLPYEERKFGSERYYSGAISWKSFHDPRFALYTNGRTSPGYVADFVKERLPIRRRVLLLPMTRAEMSVAVPSYRKLAAGKMTLRAGRPGIDWFEDAEGSIFFLPRDKGLYIVAASREDTGALEWLSTAFPR